MTSVLGRYWEDELGLSSVEYALLLALVVCGALVAWSSSLTSSTAPGAARRAMLGIWNSTDK